jgi:hypothetical protein
MAAITTVFVGAGTALVVTQPDASFAYGVGLGHFMWSIGTAAQTVENVIVMGRARRAPRPTRPERPSLRPYRWNVALWSIITAFGVAAVIAGSVADGDDAHVAAGVGTVYTVYGGLGLTTSLLELRGTKRRLQCMESCQLRPLSGIFALRF